MRNKFTDNDYISIWNAYNNGETIPNICDRLLLPRATVYGIINVFNIIRNEDGTPEAIKKLRVRQQATLVAAEYLGKTKFLSSHWDALLESDFVGPSSKNSQNEIIEKHGTSNNGVEQLLSDIVTQLRETNKLLDYQLKLVAEIYRLLLK